MGTEEKNTSHEKEIEFSRNMKEKYLPDVGKIIGKTLKSENCALEKKHPNGTFKCDLIVKTPEGNAVIIENQKEDSDHDHFGKLFTYATMLDSNDCHVTDVVWILINGKERIHIEHFNAVDVINHLCEKKGIKFKIWLLIAEYENGGYRFRQAVTDDIWKRGEGKPLHPFMVRLKEAVAKDERFKNCGNAGGAGGKCLAISRIENNYWINIPYRSREQKIKAEAIFDKKGRSNYRDIISANFLNDKDEWCEINDLFTDQIDRYGVKLEVVNSSKDEDYVKICGSMDMNSIDCEDMWDEHIVEVLDLLDRIISFADYESQKYRV